MLDTLKAEIKTSLLAGDRFRAETLKLAQASLMNARIAKTADLTEQEEIAVIQKEIKKRKESIEMYEKAGSSDRAESEAKEVAILEVFVPKMLEGKELLEAVEARLATLDVSSMSFPEVMKDCIDNLGNVDKGQLAGILKQKLSN